MIQTRELPVLCILQNILFRILFEVIMLNTIEKTKSAITFCSVDRFIHHGRKKYPEIKVHHVNKSHSRHLSIYIREL